MRNVFTVMAVVVLGLYPAGALAGNHAIPQDVRVFTQKNIRETVYAMIEEDHRRRLLQEQDDALDNEKESWAQRYLVPQHRWHVLYIGCSGFDATTTAVGLSRGARELNPLIALKPTVMLPALKVGHYILLRWLEENDSNNRHTNWIYGTSAALFCGAGVWNITQIPKKE